MTDILIVMGNYAHDLATGVLFGSALLIYGVGRVLDSDNDAERDVLVRLYRGISRILWVALTWVILGGIPRVIFFKTHEFAPASGRGLIVALGIKHVMLFVAVGVAIAMWRRVGGQVKCSARS
jgi:hypothetical protein